MGFPGNVVLIMDGDVSDADLLERAARLKTRPVRVPLFVSPDASKRDLNEWLISEGPAAIRRAMLNYSGFTPVFNDAEDQVVEAVRRTTVLQRRHVAPLRAIVSDVLRRVLPYGVRKYKGIEVGPAQWAYTRSDLAELTGTSEQTARTLVNKLRDAGFWSVRPLKAKRGILVTVYNLSSFRKLTGKDWGRSQESAITYDAEAEQSNRQRTQTNGPEAQAETAV